MILGFSIATYTLIHTVLSLVGIVAGLVVAGGLVTGTRLDRWAAVFLVTTVLANASGFGFPFTKLIASHVVGAVSLAVLAAVILADYVKHLAGPWRTTYAVGVVLATYLNVFVLVAQLFKRIPVLFLLAPTQSEPPFALTQVLVLALFVWLGSWRSRGFALGGQSSDRVSRLRYAITAMPVTSRNAATIKMSIPLNSADMSTRTSSGATALASVAA